jgi:hypothetical protein
MDEPIYVEEGEEFDNEDTAWRYITDFKNLDIIERAFKICGKRKYFKSPKEGRLWRRIDSQISKGMIHEKWVDFCLEWARQRNATICAVKIDALGHFIMNKARMQDWLMENRDALRKPSDYRVE